MSGQIYFVVASDGNKYGPADLPTLNQWAADGRIAGDTLIEMQGSATPPFPFASLPGAVVPGGMPQPDPTPAPSEQPMADLGSSLDDPAPWTPPTEQPAAAPVYPETPTYSAAYNRTTTAPVDSGNTVTKSLVLSILGIVCCGIFTAPFGLYFGMKAKRENLPNGQVAFVMGWVSLVLSILQIIGSIIYFVAIAATIPSQL
jgi:hypothetical protein